MARLPCYEMAAGQGVARHRARVGRKQILELLSVGEEGVAVPTFCAMVQGKLGIAAEHGFYIRRPGEEDWEAIKEDADSAWRDMVLPIMKVYADSTDGSYTEEKESALVWNYSNADPDFGHWQVPLPPCLHCFS